MSTTSHSSTLNASAALHLRRVRLMLWVGASLLMLMGLGWGVFFALRGEWLVVAMDTVLLTVGAMVWVLTNRWRTRLAFYLMVLSIFCVVCILSVFFDVPSLAAPRTTHHFLLILAFSSLLFLRDESGWSRHGMAAICFVAYVVLASSNFSFGSGYSMPDSVRMGGSWVNTSVSLAAVYILLHIMVSDVATASTQETDLRKGIERGEFFLVYQPQLTSAGKVVGAEALLRWQHPVRGLVSPAEFIGLAEDTGLIVPLGLQALETACRQLREWSGTATLANLTVSVNVSAQQFRQSDFVQTVKAILARTGVRPQRLKLELTESLLVDDIEDVVFKMGVLRALGVGFSLDDFGTGFSSLNYLKRLPLDQLKIDQSFVRDVLTDSSDAAIARTVISLGKSLGFAVIAEGVETDGQRQFLMDNDCHLFQGYLFSKPLPIQTFLEYVETRG